MNVDITPTYWLDSGKRAITFNSTKRADVASMYDLTPVELDDLANACTQAAKYLRFELSGMRGLEYSEEPLAAHDGVAT